VKAAPFCYHAPADLSEALALLAEHGDDAKVLAGGQSIIAVLAMRLSRFEHLVDLRRISALRGVQRTESGVRIGAMTTQASVLRDDRVLRAAPLVSRATRFIGHVPIRNRGTVGGSVAHADPAAEYPTVMCVLGAELELAGPKGTRRVAAQDFFVSTWGTVIEQDELLVSVHVPAWGPGSGFAIDEVARRHGDFAMAGAACGVQVTDGRVTRAAIGLLGVAATPVRAGTAEAVLVGSAVRDIDVEAVSRLVATELDPPGDIHASGELRRSIATKLVRTTLHDALTEATHD
jgi:carbon-monoxide dehydrogenase medium subunit